MWSSRGAFFMGLLLMCTALAQALLPSRPYTVPMALNQLGTVLAQDKLTQLNLDKPAALTASDDEGVTSFVARTFDVPQDELEVVSSLQQDDLGLSHAELRQVYKGIPVLGCTIKVHVEQDQQTVYAVTGTLAADVKLGASASRASAGGGFSAASSPAPAAETIGANAAAAIIMEHLAPYSKSLAQETSCTTEEGGASGICMQRSGAPAAPAGPSGVKALAEVAGPRSVPEKQIVRTEDGDRLVWYSKVPLSDAHTPALMHVMVDAYTGDVIQSANMMHTASRFDTPAEGIGETLFLNDVPLSTAGKSNGMYSLTDLTTRTTTCDMMNKFDGPCRDVASADNHFGNHKQTDRKTVAADIHFGLDVVNDYYKLVHGREGLDGKGTPTSARAHYGVGYDNAYWSDADFGMTFGDGTNDGTSCRGFLPLVVLNIIGHELSHGVTSTSADLMYDRESGGLNEATSDIMGMAIQQWAYENPRQVPGGGLTNIPKADWIMGAELMPARCNYFMRNMKNPQADRKSPSCWNPNIGSLDVHYSSGVGNRAFYLMVEGLNCKSQTARPAALGFDAAAKIWYRALTVYMSPTTNYYGARVATVTAAGDLYGRNSAAVDAVNAAWDIVNVPRENGVSPNTCEPTFAATSCQLTAAPEAAAVHPPSTGTITDRLVLPREEAVLRRMEAAMKSLDSCTKDFDMTVNIKCGARQATV